MPEFSMILSSDGQQVSSDGSVFQIRFADNLSIPKTANDVTLRVEAATIWWSIPNIIQGVNDTLYITGPSISDVVTNYVVVIPSGLYDLSGLEQAIQRSLENQGAKIDPSPLISLTPDDAPQRVEVRLNYVSVVVNFAANSPYTMLGFAVGSILSRPPTKWVAPNVAKFNTVNYFLLHTNLVTQGIRFNGDYNQTIAQVLIDVAPGSQINYNPYNPPKVPAQELAGQLHGTARFWLTDDKNRAVNTNGEAWSLRIVVSYM